MATIRTLLVKIGFVANTAQLDRADKKTNKLKKTAQGLSGALRAAAGAMGALALKRAALNAVDKRIKFGEDLGLLQTFLGGSIKRTAELEKSIRVLALRTGKPLSDVTRGMAEIVSAFGDGAETVDRTTIAIDAARAGFTTTLSAVRLLSGITKAYGDTSAKAMRHAADLSFQVVKDGQTSFPELGGSMGRVSSIARSAGVTMEELFAVFATGTGVIGDAAEVSTAAKAAILSLIKPTDALKKTLKQFNKEGIKTGSDLIKRKGFVGAMQALVATTDGSAESIAQLFAESKGLGLALNLSGALAGKFEKKFRAMSNTAGNTERALKAATGGFNAVGTAMKRADARATDLQIKIGTKLAPAVLDLKLASIGAAEAISEDLSLAFADMTGDAGSAIGPFRELARVISFVIKGLGFTIASVSDLLKLGVKGAAAGAAALLTDDKGRAAIKAQFRRENLPTAKRLIERARTVGQSIVDPEALRRRRSIVEMGRRVAQDPTAATAGARLEVRIDRLVAQLPEGVTAEAQGRIIAGELEKVLRRQRRDMARSVRRGVPRPADLGAE